MRLSRAQNTQYPERKCRAFVASALLPVLLLLAGCGPEKVADPPGGPPSIILAVERLTISEGDAPEQLQLIPEEGGLGIAAPVPSCGADVPWQANAAAEGELLRVYLFQPCGDRPSKKKARLDCFIAGEPAERCRRVELYLFSEEKGGFAALARIKSSEKSRAAPVNPAVGTSPP